MENKDFWQLEAQANLHILVLQHADSLSGLSKEERCEYLKTVVNSEEYLEHLKKIYGYKQSSIASILQATNNLLLEGN